MQCAGSGVSLARGATGVSLLGWRRCQREHITNMASQRVVFDASFLQIVWTPDVAKCREVLGEATPMAVCRSADVIVAPSTRSRWRELAVLASRQKDMLALECLHRYGGWWADLDVFPTGARLAGPLRQNVQVQIFTDGGPGERAPARAASSVGRVIVRAVRKGPCERVAPAARNSDLAHMGLMFGERGAPFLRKCAARCSAVWEEPGRRVRAGNPKAHVAGSSSCVRDSEQWLAHRRIATELAEPDTTVHTWCRSWAFPLSRTLQEWSPSAESIQSYWFAINVRCGAWSEELSLSVAQHALAACQGKSGGASCRSVLLHKRNKVGDLIYSGLRCLHGRGVETSAAMRMVASGLQMLTGKACDGTLQGAETDKDFASVAVICSQALRSS